MKFISSLSGYVRVKLTGADISATLDQLSRGGVEVLKFQMRSELEGILTVRRRDYRTFTKLCRSRGDTLEFLNRSGFYWTVKSLMQRPVLLTGVICYLLAGLYLPSRVFFVRVVGNTSVPARQILEAASDCGIGFGSSRRAVRSEKMKNKLLESVPELQWAGVNTYGCVAEISVRERTAPELPDIQSGFGHIVAGREGVIISCNATRGNLICGPGQAVAQGDILISGYTDCGLSIRAEQAQGEIFAATKRNLRVITPAVCRAAAKTGEEKKKLSLLIGKKRINLWKDSGIWDATYDRMYEEYYITLPGGFHLPIGWCVERYTSRELTERTLAHESLEKLLSGSAEAYLKDQMLSGTIRKSGLTFEEGEGILQMTGEFDCVEMIGFMQRLEIGE